MTKFFLTFCIVAIGFIGTTFHLSAKELTLATSLSIPPYIIKETESGIQLEIVREALKLKGHTLKKMSYVSNNRVLRMLQLKQVDGVINIPPNVPNAFYSDMIIEYENVAISLEEKGFQIKSIADLSDKRITGFQNASKFLGAEFGAMAKANRRYSEVVNQFAQVDQLFRKRTDVVIGDKRIFLYFREQYRNTANTVGDASLPIVTFDVLPFSPRKAAFHDEALRDDFNEGLQALRESGRYQGLIDSFMKDL